jgi:hypothetical protein
MGRIELGSRSETPNHACYLADVKLPVRWEAVYLLPLKLFLNMRVETFETPFDGGTTRIDVVLHQEYEFTQPEMAEGRFSPPNAYPNRRNGGCRSVIIRYIPPYLREFA